MNVLIIDPFTDDFIQALSRLPIALSYRPEAKREDVLKLISGQEILILNSKVQVDRTLIDAAPALRLVIRAGVGMDHIDEAYLAEKGIAVHNTQGANADAVGEQTVGMLLALRQHLLRADRQVRQFQWQREANRGWELGGQTVGLIGYGHTGRAVARKLSGFRCRVLAYDKYLDGYGEMFANQSTMHDIFQYADILSLHVPLTEETHEMVNQSFLARFRRPIMLLNLARGPVVHLPALLAALDEGKVIAAALDVLPNEKFDQLSDAERALYEQLFARENVILTPHIGGWTYQSRENINQRIIELVEAQLKKKPDRPG
jgi:D-3-phosphoglycerate dehydrogenase / 2-oxoglutarate reductase